MLKKVFTILDSKPARATIIFLGILLIFFGYNVWNDASAQEQKALNPTSGTLTPPYKIDPTQPIYVQVGGFGNNFTIDELKKGIDLTRFIRIDNNNETVQFPIKITFGEDGNIQVSAIITDANGNILARIVNNEWKAPSSDSTLIWYKNYNAYAFEVIDSNKIPVLQVVMGEKNTILIGFSPYLQGIPIFATLTHGFNMFPNITSTELQEMRDATIFYYPSESHLGQMKDIPDFNSDFFSPSPASYPPSNPLAESANGKILGATMIIVGGIIGAFVGMDTIRERMKKDD